MQLSVEQLHDYLAILRPHFDDDARHNQYTKLLALIDKDPSWLTRRFVAALPSGSLHAVLQLEQISPAEYQLITVRVRPNQKVEESDAALIQEACDHARHKGAQAVMTRVNVDVLTPAYQQALQNAGLRQTGERWEFKTPLEELDDDAGTPLQWQPVTDETLDGAATLLARCSSGDPDGLEPDEDPRQVIEGYLQEMDLTRTLEDCVHIGMMEGQPVAFVCAQIDPQDGWSRIAYMGLVPSHRGRGLGHWVHRHGLAMLKAQGGVLYHGGTRTNNAPMLACFQRQRCKRWQRLSEWIWRRQ